MKRVVHISVARDLSAGPSRQLGFEIRAAYRISWCEWHTIACHDVQTNYPGIGLTPRFFRAMFLRNLYFWYLVIRSSRSYDFVLTRHVTFDPFSFIFSPMVRNRLSVHHSKEIEELPSVRKGWRGNIASLLERYSGMASGRHVCAFIGVTPEIARFQREQARQPQKAIFVLPNGIDEEEVDAAADCRRKSEINIVFISGQFADWHGLDKLFSMAGVEQYNGPPIFIHLIGSLTSAQRTSAQSFTSGKVSFVIHGRLDKSSFTKVFALSDFGFAALAMERIGLKEGSTLKVREMLAAGVPVFSTHRDPSLPSDFPFFLFRENIDVRDFHEFADRVRHTSRGDIRRQSVPYISKERIMRAFLTDLFEAHSKGLM